jgi:hypothetical protein
VNTRSAERVALMLREALAGWEELGTQERTRALELDDDTAAPPVQGLGAERFPEDGLVLRVVSRDLPRASQAADWRADAWNMDHAWFQRDEARALLPAELVPGARGEAPVALVQRLARLHFVDNVRGQTLAFAAEDVGLARLEVEVVALAEGGCELRLEGETRAAAEGVWPVRGFDDAQSPGPQRRGVSTRLVGRASFDVARERFSAFELVALGERFGGTQYNGRGDDLEPAGIGFALTLAAADERVAPAHYWRYP